jgi:hypothetical protein
MNPLARILAGLLALLALAGAFFFGLVVLALAVGLGLLAWCALALRLWWLRRQAGVRGPGGPAGDGAGDVPGARQGQVIDADYEIVSRREDP